MNLWLQFCETPRAEELRILGHIAIAFFNYNQEFANIKCLKVEVIQSFWIPNGPIKGRPYHLPKAGLWLLVCILSNFSMPALRQYLSIGPLQGTATANVDQINSKSHLCDLMGKHSSSILGSKITQSRNSLTTSSHRNRLAGELWITGSGV